MNSYKERIEREVMKVSASLENRIIKLMNNAKSIIAVKPDTPTSKSVVEVVLAMAKEVAGKDADDTLAREIVIALEQMIARGMGIPTYSDIYVIAGQLHSIVET